MVRWQLTDTPATIAANKMDKAAQAGAKQVRADVTRFLLAVLLHGAAAWCGHPQGVCCFTCDFIPQNWLCFAVTVCSWMHMVTRTRTCSRTSPRCVTTCSLLHDPVTGRWRRNHVAAWLAAARVVFRLHRFRMQASIASLPAQAANPHAPVGEHGAQPDHGGPPAPQQPGQVRVFNIAQVSRSRQHAADRADNQRYWSHTCIAGRFALSADISWTT
jgi:hypothetical protein